MIWQIPETRHLNALEVMIIFLLTLAGDWMTLKLEATWKQFNLLKILNCPGGGKVDAGDLKSPGALPREGSTPSPGTKANF